MNTRLLGLIMLMLAIGFHPVSAETITPSAMTTWHIVCAPNAIESERYAAVEFQRIFKGLTGSALPIVTAAPMGGGVVLIGPDAVALAGQPTLPPKFDEEGLRIRVRANSLAIDGGRPRGTLYGVYEFFEDLCGVRFLTFDDTDYPLRGADHAISLGVRTFTPPFAFRWSYYGENSRYPAFAARLRVNTITDAPELGGRTGYRLVGHNVAYLLPPSKFGKEHPEYYALVDGKRMLEMQGGGPQLCATNPAVRELILRAVLEEIKKNPTARNVNIAQMDNDSYCTCPVCAALDAREGSHGASLLALVNYVAERVEKVYPDVLIGTYAYSYTRKPPKTLRARRNVMVQLCSIECCDLHSIDDPSCPVNRDFCRDMAVWRTRASHLFIWHYTTNFKGYLFPFPNLKSIGASVAFFRKSGARGVFMESGADGFSTELSDLRNYVMSRCLWKPGRDSWKETQEFCRLHYRESSGPILSYLTYYHRLAQHAGVHPGCFATEPGLAITGESSRKIVGYFRAAAALARSEEVRARVEKASLCALRTALAAATMKLTVKDGRCGPSLKDEDATLLDRYVALCDRYGVNKENERVTRNDFVVAMQGLYAGLKAVRIENETWRVVVLPGSNGKIAEMTYKPTGRNIAEANRGFDRYRFEDWANNGAGPAEQYIVSYDDTSGPDWVRMTVTAADGARIVRKIALVGDAIRFEAKLTAVSPRPFDFCAHPEYDTGTPSDDPRVLGIFVKAPQWVQANPASNDIRLPTTSEVVAKGAHGGAFAYFNKPAGYGVEETYDPDQFRGLELFWRPNRLQIDLKLLSQIRSLAAGESAEYAYEIRYLIAPPITQ